MKQLSSEKIQFINDYLEKSDVIFVDIRAELTDHIASAVEEKMEAENLDFYDAFKDFMVHNKKQLLRNRNSFLPPLFSFSKTLYKWYNLLIGALIIALFYLISSNNDQQDILKNIHIGLFYGILTFTALQAIYTFIILKKRFAYIEKATFWLLIIYYINLFFNGFHEDFFGNSISVGITLFLFIAFLIYFTKVMLKFNPKLFVR